MENVAFALLFFVSPALAQEPPPFEPPDRELWGQMIQAIGAISMPLSAHQQVQQILQDVEREALARAARRKAQEDAAEKR
jgi:hypothetical protein